MKKETGDIKDEHLVYFVLVPSEVTSFKNESRTAHSISLVWIEPTMSNGNIQSYLVSIHIFNLITRTFVQNSFCKFCVQETLKCSYISIKNSIKFITQSYLYCENILQIECASRNSKPQRKIVPSTANRVTINGLRSGTLFNCSISASTSQGSGPVKSIRVWTKSIGTEYCNDLKESKIEFPSKKKGFILIN